MLHAAPATEITGWSLPQMRPIVWAELTRELHTARPRFVFISGEDWSQHRRGVGRGIFSLLAQRYRVIAGSPDGTWYETNKPGRPLPEPGGNQIFRPQPGQLRTE